MTQIFKDINKITFTEVDDFIAQNDNIRYLTTPSFRSYVARQKQLYENEMLKNEPNEMKTFGYIASVFSVVYSVKVINEVWSDIPVDHFNTYFPLLTQAFKLHRMEKDSHYQGLMNPKVADWFREHCSGERFLNMLYQHCKRSGKQLVADHKQPTFVDSKYGSDQNYILAQNSTDPTILNNLSMSDNIGVVYQVAKNSHTSSETLSALVINPVYSENLPPFVMEVIALNPNTPNDIKNHIYLERGVNATESTLTDLIKQLEDMRNKNLEVPPYTTDDNGNRKKIRWRLMDVHDHIAYLYLCQSVENVEFSEVTINTPYIEGDWTVYSPQNSLELAHWAHKVDNCVLGRESSVHAGESEIVCVEENGEPRYTVEINGPRSRKNGMLRIIEIQKKGLKPGMTKDHDNFVYNMIQRALADAEKKVPDTHPS